MNGSISRVGSLASDERTKLGNLERILLLLPIAGGLVFGVIPLLLGGAFGRVLDFSGDDTFIDRSTGQL